ncbi:glutathione S-transferase 1-1 [Rhipicephalus sanguineus]|uniref:Glutathione S-transferase n=1 Tax=Rhipicephalus sanguineus TaxID=34632 RepID=A0A9D4YQU9_RHISA|nr:glutathione S-transferase 1-1 [Rhipicephalus sanguineus]KAH7984537.1 hypothetical protein HPB52_022235 [Rhipicephalus sanguineus]
MPPKLYSIPTSPTCGFVRLVAKELNVKICVKNLNFSRKEHLSRDYMQLNPFGKVPTLEDRGFVVHESTAIAYYLLRKYAPKSQLYPDCPRKRARIDQILATVASTIRPHFVEFSRKLFCDDRKPTDEEKASFNRTVVQGLVHLIEGPFAVGDSLTLADLCIVANLTIAFINGFVEIDNYTALEAYYDRVLEELPYLTEIFGEAIGVLLQRRSELLDLPVSPTSE